MGFICLYVLIHKSGQKTAKSHLKHRKGTDLLIGCGILKQSKRTRFQFRTHLRTVPQLLTIAPATLFITIDVLSAQKFLRTGGILILNYIENFGVSSIPF